MVITVSEGFVNGIMSKSSSRFFLSVELAEHGSVEINVKIKELGFGLVSMFKIDLRLKASV